MKTKYIITKEGNAIVFASEIPHNTFKHLNPISAGFVDFFTCVMGLSTRCKCSGKSGSLKLKSREEEDEEIINVQILNNY